MPARLLIQVHDSLLFEFPASLTDEVIHAVNLVMTQPWPELGGMIIPVEMKLGNPGDSWGELKKIS